ncbi:MAG: translation elongation factor 4 [Chloroflexota bacterium]|nr:translation elongation factor 4 [Chloroflexota bacterium]MDE2895908.1 translation elongation factor 4 [Chloroflexota bacterium]
MDASRIRNFCIVAHIDHGKSTLSDRLIEATATVDRRDMSDQLLDSMDLEREKGITIKARAVRMDYRRPSGDEYRLHLIDTPGHVDFSYEVSRSLAAAEGALLVVDAVEGIQAQTLANVYLAMEQDMTLIPVVNKIDLDIAQPEAIGAELVDVIGFSTDEILYVSAKTGQGIDELLDAIVDRIPPPEGAPLDPLRALIFDSEYDSYKGVIAHVRVVDGDVKGQSPLRLAATNRRFEAMEVGSFSPELRRLDSLSAGDVGYVATGLKDVADVRVGDTMTIGGRSQPDPLPGYREPKAMVFAGLYPANSADYQELSDALDKLRLSDSAIQYQPESSAALGFGYRMGFLGLLHMEIVQERLEREYGLELVFTAPSVEYEVEGVDGQVKLIENPSDLPAPNHVSEIREPWVRISVIAPHEYVGPVMETVTSRRGVFDHMEYLQRSGQGNGANGANGSAQTTSEIRVLLEYELPLSEILTDFYDELKSRTRGYASLDYSLVGYRPAKLVKLDLLINGEPVDALSAIVHSDAAASQGRELADRLRRLIPRQLFDVPIQAAVGGRIIARETVRAMRKNVTAKCYGGDITRKRKLLARQAEGKRRLKRVGNVEIPQEAFLAVLQLGKD